MNSFEHYWTNDANSTLVNLQEGANEYYYISSKRNIYLQQWKVHQPIDQRSCVSMKLKSKSGKITKLLTYDEGARLDIAFVAIEVSEKSRHSIQEAILYITSERNSFGAVFNGWYDGKSNPVPLVRSGILNIQISEMKRFEYLEKTCNASSFYECVGEKLMTQKECASNGVPCTRYSFPNNKPPFSAPQTCRLLAEYKSRQIQIIL